MAIAYQPATTPAPTSARAVLARSPHDIVVVDLPRRSWTLAKIAGLVTLTALGLALATAVVVGTALFALMNLGG